MKQILGIDVGGTKIAAGLIDKSFRVTKLAVLSTSQTDLVKQLVNLIRSYESFSAIGLGMPGQVLANGMITRLPNVNNFKSINFKKILEDKFKVPVNILNDAKAFALAEASIGVGRAYKTVAGVILGTGIGVGIIMDKKIYFGKDGIAGEYEHTVLLDSKMFRDHRHSTGTFKQAANTNKYLKTLLDMIVLSFNPDIIILGGAWSKLSGMEKLANQLTKNVGNYINKTPVKISKLKYAGIIGAALPLLKK